MCQVYWCDVAVLVRHGFGLLHVLVQVDGVVASGWLLLAFLRVASLVRSSIRQKIWEWQNHWSLYAGTFC